MGTGEATVFRSIVVGTDGTPTARRAVAKAQEIARLSGAHLHLVSAYRAPAQVTTAEAMLVTPVISEAEIRGEVEHQLGLLAKEVSDSGIEVTTYAVPGNAAQAILDVAEHQDADLVVVGNRGMKGARRLLGSVPNNVAHHAPCAVMIVHTT